MFLERFLRPRSATTAGRALYSQAVSRARREALFSTLRVPDTVEGRFEA